MNTFIAAVWLLVTPAVFGQGQPQNRNQEPVTPAAKRSWTSAAALNRTFKNNAVVKHFLNEVANAGDPGGPTSVVEVFDHRVVDLNRDGRLELVALVRGDRPSTFLEIVFQTPGHVPPTDRLASTYDGFVVRELSHVDVPDLNTVLRDLDGDGTYEIVAPQIIGEVVGASRPQAEIPEVFAWKQGDYANVSARYPEFYRNEVLPRLERQLQKLKGPPGPADPSTDAGRLAEREKVMREIAEARKRATHE